MSSSVVVDASLIVELVLRLPAAETIARRVSGLQLHAPHVINSELVHALRRRWLAGELDDERGVAALDLAEKLQIIRHSEIPFMKRMWALRENFTAYDATYIALAELLDIPLLTHDGKMSRASGHRARIELVE